jgi:GT2 family glycosyltransferase
VNRYVGSWKRSSPAGSAMRTLDTFHGVHSGQKIVVCGLGQSLNQFVDPHRFITIGVNDIGRLFHPDYLLVTDKRERFQPRERFQYVEQSQAKYLLSDLDLGVPHPNVVKFKLGDKEGTDFSDLNAVNYTSITPYMALCVAVHLGARLIGLVGVDFSDHHFFGKTGPHPQTPQLSIIDRQFRRLNDALVERGVKIFNLSSQSLLTAFPKMPLEEFANLTTPSTLSPKLRPLRVVSYSVTPVAGVPAILTRCINARTPHFSRCVWASGDYGNGVVYEGDIRWDQFPGAASDELARADVVIVHNGKIAPPHRLLLESKATVTMAHNYIWNVDQGLVQRGFPGVVVGQYQATLPEFSGWTAVPNPIPLWEADYQPGNKPPEPTICYLPSGQHDHYPQNHRLYWHSKGYSGTMGVLEKLMRQYPVQLYVLRDSQVSHAESLRMKRASHVVIDECVTGSYHRTSLEGLATGGIVVNRVGPLSKVLEMLRYCAGSDTANPFIHASLETLERVLVSLVERGPEELAVNGVLGRQWMERHWDFGRQWGRFWMPAIEQAMEHQSRPTISSHRTHSQSTSAGCESVDVSVIVVALNEGEDLRRTVENLASRMPRSSEIVVVDDCSTDGSSDFLLTGGHMSFTLLRSGVRMGVARARNFAAEHARGNILVFSDAHVFVPHDCFDPLLAELSDERVGAVGPGIAIMGQTPATQAGYGQRWRNASLDVGWMDGAGLNTCQVPLLGRSFVAMRRDVFTAVGGYDPGMIHWGAEDSELCIRLWTLGYECRVVPTVSVEHRFRPERPYEIGWETVLYNKLRLATLHFSPERLGRVVHRLQQSPAFPAARERLSSTDAETRRTCLWSIRRYDDEWFFRKFAQAMTPELCQTG